MRACPKKAQIFFVLLALVSGLAPGQEPIPRGGEFQVNTYTTDRQSVPEVSSDGAGGFVIAWRSEGSSGTDSDGHSVQGQRYASDGSPLGSQFQANTYTTGSQSRLDVSPMGDGGFVITWRSVGSSGTDSDGYSIQGQRYGSEGVPTGGEFQVNTYTTSYQDAPAVGPDGAGGFVIAWESDGSYGTDSDGYSIQAHRYAPDGSPVGSQFQVNTYTTSEQFFANVGSDGSGGFVVVWHSFASGGTDSDNQSIQGQRYASDGSPAGSQFQANTYTTGSQTRPVVGSKGGDGFVVAWQSFGSETDPSDSSVQAQLYAADGSPAGGQFQVNTYTTDDQNNPAVSSDSAGGFLVTWTSTGSNGTDSSASSVQGRRYASDGAPSTGEFQVNTSTLGGQYGAAVGPDGTGGLILTWASLVSTGDDSDSFSIQGQLYDSPIFADGFESGDTSAWSQTVP